MWIISAFHHTVNYREIPVIRKFFGRSSFYLLTNFPKAVMALMGYITNVLFNSWRLNMKIHIKAALLSALVFPGLGQFYKGDRIKGVILLACVNILLLIIICLVLQQLMPLIINGNGISDTNKILEGLNSGSPLIRKLLAMLGGLWFYSWIDAAVWKKRGNNGLTNDRKI
jgi:TM2 domain-containing membrane protein YozV